MLETERLILKPLTYRQLKKYCKNDGSLEADLHLNPGHRTISADLKEALEVTILPNVANTNKNYLFCTLWTLILKSENKMIGDLCFTGEPDAEGRIEIGYGMYDDYRNKGYMTEAVAAMIEWAGRQSGVSAIVAATEKTNLASSAVLGKNGFVRVEETDQLVQWILGF